MTEFIELLLRGLTGLTLFFALVFVVGIVWRVEAELDIAYKWFSLSVIFFLVSEVISVLPAAEIVSGSMTLALMRFGSAVTLLLGMYYMRDLVRRMDGEKKPLKQ